MVIEAPLSVAREFHWAYTPFQIGKVLQYPPLSPAGEKRHSSHMPSGFSEVSGFVPKTPSEDCSFSVIIVSLPDYVATETKISYALKIRFLMATCSPHSLV